MHCSIGGARNAEAGGQRGGKDQGTRGNNILCVCGTNVNLYIQLSCASKRCRASVDQSPWSGVRTQGASGFYPHNYRVEIGPSSPSLLGSSSPSTFGLKPPLGLLVKGVDCPVKMGGFVKGVDCLVKYRGSFDLHF